MVSKLIVAIAISLVAPSCAAQVVPQGNYRPPLALTTGGGMDYFSGDWEAGILTGGGRQPGPP
jgi:hypothetical protein